MNQEVRHHQGGWGHSLDHPPCLDKSQNSGFLRKSIFLILGKLWDGLFLRKTIFFIFWGLLQLYLDTKTFLGIRNLTFGGVLPLTFFDPSNDFLDFQGCDCQNGELSTPKTLIGSKNVRSKTPPKVRFLMQNKVLESKKSYRGPQKI